MSGVAEARRTPLAIIETAHPRVSANGRPRAIELLAAAGGGDEGGTLWVARWLAGMSDAELAVVIDGFDPPAARIGAVTLR